MNRRTIRLGSAIPLALLLLAGALWPSPAVAQTVPFSPVTNFGAGPDPVSVAIGDLNGDGTPDLVVANINTDTVSVLLGTGGGSFGAAASVPVGLSPIFIAIGDLNGDGTLDLAVANQVSNNVSVILGTGTGTFGTATNFAVGQGPTSIAMGDLNGDGRPDLAVANQGSSFVSVLLGTGAGNFGAATQVVAGASPRSVAIGNFNGDGKPDLAVTNQGSSLVSVLLGTGTGAFGAATIFFADVDPFSLAIGDLNGDGKADLAVANINTSSVSVLVGTVTGSFGAATWYPMETATAANQFPFETYPSSLAMGDLNGDGALDLAVANHGSHNVSVLLGTGTGSFGGATNFAVGQGPISMTMGDLNDDGRPDLAVAIQNRTIGNIRAVRPGQPRLAVAVAAARPRTGLPLPSRDQTALMFPIIRHGPRLSPDPARITAHDAPIVAGPDGLSAAKDFRRRADPRHGPRA